MADMALKDYDPAYVEHVIKPFLRESFFQSETPDLPLIGRAFSKEYALPYDLWGLLYDDWAHFEDCLINNVTGELTVRSGAAIPNRIGVVDGRTDQHGYAARDHGGGGRPLSISGADG